MTRRLPSKYLKGAVREFPAHGPLTIVTYWRECSDVFSFEILPDEDARQRVLELLGRSDIEAVRSFAHRGESHADLEAAARMTQTVYTNISCTRQSQVRGLEKAFQEPLRGRA